MKDYKNFGIVITCYKGDFFFTKGLLASIKYFCGDIPICIIVDGNIDVSQIVKTYNIVKIIRKQDVKNEYLRNNCFGSRLTNLIAFWESPFEYFMYVDSDTVLWGNVLENFTYNMFDFVHNEPHEAYSPFIMKHQYFDYDKIFEFTEYFKWEGCHFFNAGIFVMKKGIFNIDETKVLIELFRKDKKLLPRDIQGVINILAYRTFAKGTITLSEAHLQTIMPLFSKEELSKKFIIKDKRPVVEKNTILHWAGVKPLLRQNVVFNEPALFFRKQNLIYSKSLWRFMPKFYFWIEEIFAIYQVYYKSKPKKILKKVFGLK